MSEGIPLKPIDLFKSGVDSNSFITANKTTYPETADNRRNTHEFYPAGPYQLLPNSGVVPFGGAIPNEYMLIHGQPLIVMTTRCFRSTDKLGPTCRATSTGFVKRPSASAKTPNIWEVKPGMKFDIDPCSYEKGLVVPLDKSLDVPKGKTFDMQPRPPQESKAAQVTPPPPPPDKSLSKNGRNRTYAGIQRKFEFSYEYDQTPSKPVKKDELTPPTTPLRAGQSVRIPTGKIKMNHDGQQSLSPNLRQQIYPWEVPSAVRLLWSHTDQNKRKPYHNTPVMVHDAKTGLLRILMPHLSQIGSVVAFPTETNILEFPNVEALRGIVTSGPTCYLVTGRNSGFLVPISTAKDRVAIFIRRGGKEQIDFSDPKCLAAIPAGSAVGNFFHQKVCAEIIPVQPGESSVQINLFEFGTRTPDFDSRAAANALRDFRDISREQKSKEAFNASQITTQW